MSYLDLWKKKQQIGGKNYAEKLDTHTKSYINKQFANSNAYRKATVVNLDLSEEEIDLRITNVQKTPYIKRFYFRPEQKVNTGMLFKFDDKVYLGIHYEYNMECPMIEAKECRQTINNEWLPFPVHCVAEDSAYNDKGQIFTDFFNLVDGKLAVYLPDNKYTKFIKQNQRYIFNQSDEQVFEVISKKNVVDKNVYKLVLTKVEADMEKDDFENNIAFNSYNQFDATTDEDKPTGYTIMCNSHNGQLNVRRYSSVEFTICKDGLKSLENWTIDVDNNSVPSNWFSVVNKTNNSIKIKNLKGDHKNNIILTFKNDTETITVDVDLTER